MRGQWKERPKVADSFLCISKFRVNAKTNESNSLIIDHTLVFVLCACLLKPLTPLCFIFWLFPHNLHTSPHCFFSPLCSFFHFIISSSMALPSCYSSGIVSPSQNTMITSPSAHCSTYMFPSSSSSCSSCSSSKALLFPMASSPKYPWNALKKNDAHIMLLKKKKSTSLWNSHSNHCQVVMTVTTMPL